MILETAALKMKSGQELDFEAAAKEASPILARQKGHLAHRFEKCTDTAGRYFPLVWWKTLEDHTEGFRKSADYQEWRRLLHHFYDPFPNVEYYASIAGQGRIPDD